MTMSKVEAFVLRAKQQASLKRQGSLYDIAEYLIQAVDELSHDLKRMDNEVRRIRRDVRRLSLS